MVITSQAMRRKQKHKKMKEEKSRGKIWQDLKDDKKKRQLKRRRHARNEQTRKKWYLRSIVHRNETEQEARVFWVVGDMMRGEMGVFARFRVPSTS
jgi:hypothetical protein